MTAVALCSQGLAPACRLLRAAGINVVAIHRHMTEEEPRIVFFHYWGIGPAVQLAYGLKSALEAQAALAARR